MLPGVKTFRLFEKKVFGKLARILFITLTKKNKSGIYPGASPGQNVVHFVVMGLFPLKKPATPPRAVALWSCETPCIRFSHIYRPRGAGYYTLVLAPRLGNKKDYFLTSLALR